MRYTETQILIGAIMVILSVIGATQVLHWIFQWVWEENGEENAIEKNHRSADLPGWSAAPEPAGRSDRTGNMPGGERMGESGQPLRSDLHLYTARRVRGDGQLLQGIDHGGVRVGADRHIDSHKPEREGAGTEPRLIPAGEARHIYDIDSAVDDLFDQHNYPIDDDNRPRFHHHHAIVHNGTPYIYHHVHPDNSDYGTHRHTDNPACSDGACPARR